MVFKDICFRNHDCSWIQARSLEISVLVLKKSIATYDIDRKHSSISHQKKNFDHSCVLKIKIVCIVIRY